MIGPVGTRAASCARGDDSAAAYPTLVDKAAALLHGIARNRALVEGNKRLAWASARVFLLMHGHSLSYAVDDAERVVLGVARGDLDVAQSADWFRPRVRAGD